MRLFSKLKLFLLSTKIPAKFFMSKKECPQFHSESFGKKLSSLMEEYNATISVTLNKEGNTPTFWFSLGSEEIIIGGIFEEYKFSAKDVRDLGKPFTGKDEDDN